MTFTLPTKISVYIIITFTGIIILTDNITNCRGTMPVCVRTCLRVYTHRQARTGDIVPLQK